MTSKEFLIEIAGLKEFLEEFKLWLNTRHLLQLKDVLAQKSISLYPFLLEFIHDKYKLEIEYKVLDDNTKWLCAFNKTYSRDGKLGSNIDTRTATPYHTRTEFWAIRYTTMLKVLTIINKPF